MEDWLPNGACTRIILEKVQILRKAHSSIFAFVRGLNNTEIHRGRNTDFVTPLMDPDIAYDLKRLYKECEGNACFEAMKSLLFFVYETDLYTMNK
jgi:hypothetical protein